jgi:hypothetical protein
VGPDNRFHLQVSIPFLSDILSKQQYVLLLMMLEFYHTNSMPQIVSQFIRQLELPPSAKVEYADLLTHGLIQGSLLAASSNLEMF